MDQEVHELIQTELITIQKNLDLSAKINQEPLTENGYRILKELNNHDPSTGFKIYSRDEPKYFTVSGKDIIKQVNLSDEEFEQELKVLFLKFYIDYDFVLNDQLKEIVKSYPELTVKRLKFGTSLDIHFSSQGIQRFRLTDRGLFAMIDYNLKEMISLQEKLSLTKKEVNETIQQQQGQLDEYRVISEKVNEDLVTINNNFEKINKKVSRFNENIFTIFSLMIAAFAVIGINISSIPKIEENFILNVLTINFSICFSLIVLFYLLNVIVHKGKNTGLGLLLIGFGVIFLIVIVLNFVNSFY